MTKALPSLSGRKTAAASAGNRSRAHLTALRSRSSRSSDANISSFASCSRRRRARLGIRVKGGTRYANLPLGGRATDAWSTRKNDFHHVAADLARDSVRQLTRGLSTE